ncbi:MAG: FMN-binding negative transcriptional regulator [Armatimonadetes bacterium]|nr:FMN-binding negative transcriptional regulator [Armatimonadota bacterium]
MYVPEWFKIEDPAEIVRICRENSFATLFTAADGALSATHLPLVVEAAEPLTFLGHLAVANPHRVSLEEGEPQLAVFHGPHAYVSPQVYATSPNVPTWNYVAVHVTGRPEVLSSEEALDSLAKLVQEFDPEYAVSGSPDMDRGFWQQKLSGVIAFRLVASRVEAKAKLSQNKPERDFDRVVSEFAKQAPSVAQEMIRLRGQS